MLVAATGVLETGFDMGVLGEYHYWTDGTTVLILCCYPSLFSDAKEWLEGRGAVVAPSLNDPITPVGEAFAALIPPVCNVFATDITWTAADKIADGLGWPAIDPDES